MWMWVVHCHCKCQSLVGIQFGSMLLWCHCPGLSIVTGKHSRQTYQYPYWLQHWPVGQVYLLVPPQEPSGDTLVSVSALRTLSDLAWKIALACKEVARERATRQKESILW